MQPKARELVIEGLMKYLDSDGMLCREEPGLLARAQSLARSPPYLSHRYVFSSRFLKYFCNTFFLGGGDWTVLHPKKIRF